MVFSGDMQWIIKTLFMQLLISFQKVPFSTLSTLILKKVRKKVTTPVWVVNDS